MINYDSGADANAWKLNFGAKIGFLLKDDDLRCKQEMRLEAVVLLQTAISIKSWKIMWF